MNPRLPPVWERSPRSNRHVAAPTPCADRTLCGEPALQPPCRCLYPMRRAHPSTTCFVTRYPSTSNHGHPPLMSSWTPIQDLAMRPQAACGSPTQTPQVNRLFVPQDHQSPTPNTSHYVTLGLTQGPAKRPQPACGSPTQTPQVNRSHPTNSKRDGHPSLLSHILVTSDGSSRY